MISRRKLLTLLGCGAALCMLAGGLTLATAGGKSPASAGPVPQPTTFTQALGEALALSSVPGARVEATSDGLVTSKITFTSKGGSGKCGPDDPATVGLISREAGRLVRDGYQSSGVSIVGEAQDGSVVVGVTLSSQTEVGPRLPASSADQIARLIADLTEALKTNVDSETFHLDSASVGGIGQDQDTLFLRMRTSDSSIPNDDITGLVRALPEVVQKACADSGASIGALVAELARQDGSILAKYFQDLQVGNVCAYAADGVVGPWTHHDMSETSSSR